MTTRPVSKEIALIRRGDGGSQLQTNTSGQKQLRIVVHGVWLHPNNNESSTSKAQMSQGDLSEILVAIGKVNEYVEG